MLITAIWALAGCAAISDARIEQQQDLISQLDREVLALRERTSLLEQQAKDCDDPTAAPDEIYAQLHQIFSGAGVTVERDGRTTLVTVPGTQLFSPGSTVVRQEATMVLDLLATAINLHEGRRVLIEGHTDDTAISGSLKRAYATNWELSAARAGAFARVLVEEFAVDPVRITIAGRGEYDPIADNSTPEGRAVNRRIVVYIYPKEE